MIYPSGQEMVRSMIAQTAEAYPLLKRRKETILPRYGLSSSRTEQKYTIRNCIGVGGANKQATGATSLGNRQDSPGDY